MDKIPPQSMIIFIETKNSPPGSISAEAAMPMHRKILIIVRNIFWLEMFGDILFIDLISCHKENRKIIKSYW